MYVIYKKSHALNEVILFGFHIFEDSSDLESLLLLSIELPLILEFCFHGDSLKLFFLLDFSIFIKIDEKKRTKINSSIIFEGCYLNFDSQ